jgi:hypothetical protein
MNPIFRFVSRVFLGHLFCGLLIAWTPVILFGSQYLDPFTPKALGVGGDQHQNGTTSFFTNIVYSAVGDLDGDGNQDIVLLSNAVPHNGAYKPALVNANRNFNMWYHRGEWDTKYPGVQFLNPGDRLYGVDDGVRLPASFNPTNTTQPWFVSVFFASLDAGIQARIGTLHFAPPSPNVVMGLVNSPPYTGSEVAWLRGDGRGNFHLLFVTPFGSDGVTPAPVRIRMGFKLVLARMRDPGQVGLDIVLASANDMDYSYPNDVGGLFPSNTTSIKPFTGTGRVFWLENRGWNAANTNLNFVDHSIAEYNHDRPATTFYQVTGNSWDPHGSLFPTDIHVRDINENNRPDVIVQLSGIESSVSRAQDIYLGTPAATTLLSRYNPLEIRLPVNGEKWWTGSVSVYGPMLIWYENRLIAGQPHLSTATFNMALDGANNPIYSVYGPFKPQKISFLRLGGGEEAIASIPQLNQAGIRTVTRRHMPPDTLYPLKLLNSTVITLNNELFGVYGADMNGDGIDEALFDEHACVSGNCTARLHIYTVSPSGSTDVTVSPLPVATITPPTDNYVRYRCPPWAIADFNQDGFNDLVSPTALHSGSSTALHEPFNLFLSGGAGSPFTYRQLIQKQPKVGHTVFSNGFQGTAELDLPRSFISTGDFNGDGFPDIVRTGPAIPAMLFINDLAGLQRAVITSTSKHGTGTQATWTSVYSGEFTPGGVVISTTPIAHAMDTP